jgi:hypothetical protein
MTAGIIVPDPSLILIAGYTLFAYRAYILVARVGTPHHRELNRARQGWLAKLPHA